jgi:RNA polymerase-binding transcription factor DksA
MVDTLLTSAESAVARNVLVALRSYVCFEAELFADAVQDLEMESGRCAAPAWSAARPSGGAPIADNLKSFSQDLLRRKQTTIERIDHALERLNDGTYGACLACKSPIPAWRLAQAPYADRCGRCQMKRLMERKPLEPKRGVDSCAPRTKTCRCLSS